MSTLLERLVDLQSYLAVADTSADAEQHAATLREAVRLLTPGRWDGVELPALSNVLACAQEDWTDRPPPHPTLVEAAAELERARQAVQAWEIVEKRLMRAVPLGPFGEHPKTTWLARIDTGRDVGVEQSDPITAILEADAALTKLETKP